MFRKRTIGAVVGLAAAALVLAGCASDGGGSTDAAGGDTPYVALVSKGFQHQFWQAVKSGAEQAAEEFGVEITFEGPDTEADVDQQIQMLQTALDKSPDAVGFAALDSQAAGPLLQQAKDAGIPVIAFDSGVDSDIPLTTAATDNLAAAAEAAKHMAEAVGHEGKVALVVHDQTSVTGQQRRDGFVDYMEDERAEHRDRRHPVRRRRPGEVGRPREGDHRGQPRPQGHLRLERGLGDRRRAGREGARASTRRSSSWSASTRARPRWTRSATA